MTKKLDPNCISYLNKNQDKIDWNYLSNDLNAISLLENNNDEIFLQILIMFCGIIFIHRTITYIPTYSGFNYEAMNFTNVILAFLVIILCFKTFGTAKKPN
jgi:hypothetical protein